VVGFKLSGKLQDGVTTTDIVLTMTQMLRKHGAIGKFVEFYGKHSMVYIVGRIIYLIHISFNIFSLYFSFVIPVPSF
jgi:hypothetical protein